MTIKKKLGNSAKWEKLLNAKHYSMATAIKHAANTEINKAAREYDTTESHLALSVKNLCISTAKDKQTEAANKCQSDYHSGLNIGEKAAADLTKTLADCTTAAQTEYTTSETTCTGDFDTDITAVGATVDGVMGHLFDCS